MNSLSGISMEARPALNKYVRAYIYGADSATLHAAPPAPLTPPTPSQGSPSSTLLVVCDIGHASAARPAPASRIPVFIAGGWTDTPRSLCDPLGEYVLADVFSSPEAAALLGLTQGRIRTLLIGGLLRGRKLGRSWMIEWSEIERFAALDRPAHRPALARIARKR